VLLAVEGERITGLETDVPLPPADSIQLHGLTVPALANGHSHAFQRGLRGRTQDRRGSFWTWREQMYRMAEQLDPDNYYELARAVYAEMAEAGFGLVGEFHYVHHQPEGAPYAASNAMGEAIVAAADSAGVRLTLLDTLYLKGGFASTGSDPYVELGPRQRRFSDESVWAWVERARSLKLEAETGTVMIGGAIHSVRAVDPIAMRVAAEWSNEYEAPLHVHVSEQRQENQACEDQFSWSPVELLRREDVLGPRTTLVHATHATTDDLAVIADAGASVCMCPTTERDLADGIGPSRELADLGVSMSIGSDSHAVIDPFEELRALELNQRLRTFERGAHQPSDLLEIGTVNGYRALGWPDGGALAVGGLADFTTIRLDSVRTAGSEAETLLGTAVFAAGAVDVVHVVVAGRTVVENGRHATIDTAGSLDRAIDAVGR
jgi:formiminoglutamate deiminase